MASLISVGRTVFGALKQEKIVRFQSSLSSALLDVKVNDKNGTAIVAMKHTPVNALSLDMLQGLAKCFKDLEANKCRGMILTSSIPSIFCAGLDIREMHNPDKQRFETFIYALQSVWLTLYGSKMATVAMHNGHAIAGGCMLGLACDYRIMVKGKFNIGLNEAALGIVAPIWLKEGMANVLGVRKADLALQRGSLFSVEEAYQIGLLDQVAPDVQTGIAIAEKELQEFLKIPDTSRYETKMRVRGLELKGLSDNWKAHMHQFVSFASTPTAQLVIGKYLENLKTKK